MYLYDFVCICYDVYHTWEALHVHVQFWPHRYRCQPTTIRWFSPADNRLHSRGFLVWIGFRNGSTTHLLLHELHWRQEIDIQQVSLVAGLIPSGCCWAYIMDSIINHLRTEYLTGQLGGPLTAVVGRDDSRSPTLDVALNAPNGVLVSKAALPGGFNHFWDVQSQGHCKTVICKGL